MKPMKVGELARRAGVSVRTLHYYEEIGLLKPDRTASGHRCYQQSAIQALQQVRSLQQLGFSLSEITALLTAGEITPVQVVAEHLAKVRAQAESLRELEARLTRLQGLLRCRQPDEGETVDALLNTLEAMTMYENYLTPQQSQQIADLHEAAGDAQSAWTEALEAIRSEMLLGSEPSSPKAQSLVKKWHAIAEKFMPADDNVHAGVMKLLHDEPNARREHGIDDDLFAFLGEAMAPEDHT
jgi:DNA-binding transcriptional MerR regulator